MAQPGRTVNPLVERFKLSRIEVPDSGGGLNEKFQAMRKGNVALDPPAAADIAVLDTVAKQIVYPITHWEYYSAADTGTAELAPRAEEKNTARLIVELRGNLVFVPPGANIPGPQQDFAREFGAAVVRAVDDVLKKTNQPAIRVSAVRMLAVVAETGAPAATDRVIQILQKKDAKDSPVEVLYYGLKAAEQAIAMYDSNKSAEKQKWVTRDKFFELVSLVDEVVRQVPAVVAEKTHLPDQPPTPPATPADPKPTPAKELTPEQVATVQMFRLQAVRALAKVRTDVVTDTKQEKLRRPMLTLARIAASDAGMVPPPTRREVGEALLGIANMVPSADDLDANVLGVVIARGVSDFITEKAAADRDGGAGPQVEHWKLYGARMKVAFQNWDTVILAKTPKVSKAGKDTLREIAQLAINRVFDPLSKQSDTGVVNGLQKDAIDEWFAKRTVDSPSSKLYTSADDSTVKFGK